MSVLVIMVTMTMTMTMVEFFLSCVIGGDRCRGAWYLTARGLADRIQFESYCLLEWHISDTMKL